MLLVVTGCQKSLVNISEGHFNVYDPPIVIPQISDEDSTAKLSLAYSRQFGDIDTIGMIGIENQSVTSNEGGELHNEQANLKYIVDHGSNTLYLNITKELNEIKTYDIHKFISGQIGIMPFPYIGLAYTFKKDIFGIGSNAYAGYVSTKETFSGRYVYDVGGIDGGWAEEGLIDNYSSKHNHANVGLGIYSFLIYKHLKINYYGGIYYPWMFSNVQYRDVYGAETFETSFDFPYICVNQVKLSYELFGHMLLGLMINQYSGKNFEEVDRKFGIEIQIK